MEPTEPSEANLRDYLHVLGRRKGTIAFAVFILVFVVLLSIVLQTPVYKATTSVLLKPRSTDTLFNPNANLSVDPARDVQTEIQVVASEPVRQAVKKQLGAAPKINVAPMGTTNVIGISAQSTDARTAATVANTYADAYINYRRTQDVNDALAAGSQIKTKIVELQHQIDALNAQVKAADPKGQASVSALLAPQVDSLVTQAGTFKQQLGQLQVSAALKSGGAQIVNPAPTPDTPVKPRPVRDLILAMMAGLVLGVGAAFSLEYLDDSVRSSEDLERAIPGVPNVAAIPFIGTWRTKEEPLLVSVTDPQSPAAEAYRALRTSIQFSSLDRPLRTLLIASPSAGEGKTTTLANLGVALAQVGQQVILTCCDLRRPRLHEFFGLDNSVGFTSVYLGEVPAAAALQVVPGVPGLRILASGPLPPNPSELLSSERTAEVLNALKGEADIVLIDSPPVLPVTDAAVISRLVDTALLVVTAGATTRRQVAHAVDILSKVDAPLLGTVLNGLSSEGSYGSAYQYYRYERESSRRWDLNAKRRRAADEQPRPTPRVNA